MNAPNNSGGVGGVLAVAGAALAMIVCCAGPALIAGGVLTGLGGALTSPWLLGAGLLVTAAALGYTLRRRAAGKAARCCPPSPAQRPTTTAGDHDREKVRHEHREY
ncbi:hypothetical protein [Tsukamurella columbiensis]|uniref:hypothetical protein n=1 Tax=Tsukamurella columbiensis TaxID=128509 RepID=UPI00223B79BF|nr:hypothetical protein [Tsukamurella columbiensis]